MIADKDEQNDVAIHWPRRTKTIAGILRSGKCPSHALPRRVRPGGLVALTASDGEVLLLFRLASIEENRSVVGADGTRYPTGCYLIATRGTVRRPRGGDPKVLNVNRHGLGAFAYFDAATFERVVYKIGDGNATVGKSPVIKQTTFPSRQVPLFANNIGKILSQPERRLILAYAKWVGDVAMFVHHPLRQTGLYTDLFIPRCWTLFEAKASTARRSLREAVGQLFDYQRHYDRSPRLAVLLPERPQANVMGLFERKRIVVVWRSTGGAFRDTADGALTGLLRKVAHDNHALEREARTR